MKSTAIPPCIMLNVRSALLVIIMIMFVVPPAHAIEAAISELRARLAEAEDTEEVIDIAEQTINEGKQTIERLRNEVDKLQSEKADLKEVQATLTSGLIGALVTAFIAIVGTVSKLINSKAERNLRRLEIMEKLTELESKGITIPGDIRKNYAASAYH